MRNKLILATVFTLLVLTPAFAGDNGNKATHVESESKSTAIAGSTASASNTGIQANGQESEQSSSQSQSHEEKNRNYANAWPALSGQEGVSQANAYSVFGGIGLSNTEPYKRYIVQIQAIEASQTLTASEKQLMTSKLFDRMMDTNKKQRFLGLFWETSGRNLMNGFGLLAWDSFWQDKQKPFKKAK